MKSIKMLTITSNFPLYKYDIANKSFVYEMCKLFLENKIDVHVLTPHYQNADFEEEIDGLKIHRFPYVYPYSYQKVAYGSGMPYNIKNSIFVRIQLPFFLLSEFLSASKIVRDEKINIIHSHWLIPQGLVGAMCKKILKVKHITTIHSSEITLIKKMPYGRKIIEFVINNTDDIISVSSHRAKELLTFISPKIGQSKKIEIIPMGVDLENYKNNAELKLRYDIKSKFTILFVGGLIEVKGCEYLIKSLKLILDVEDICLIIVGSGALYMKLKKLVEELNLKKYVRFEGYVDHNRIKDYYSISDVFVIPSIVDSSGFEEGMPLVLLEAMTAGKPIIATSTKGIKEVIIDGYNGLLVEPKNSKQIADSILLLLGDSNLRNRISKAALKSSKDYSWDIVIEKYLKMINDVIER